MNDTRVEVRWCGWCHTSRPPHSHEVEGYRLFNTAETKREVISIMLDNVFRTPTSRHVHWDTLQYLHNRLFFRQHSTDCMCLTCRDARVTSLNPHGFPDEAVTDEEKP